MKRFTEVGVTLEPRGIGRCIDLAFRFVGQEWPRVLGLTCGCAIPAAALTSAGASATEFGWLIATLMVALWSLVLGSLLVTHAASIVFCEPVTPARLCWIALWHTGPVLMAKGLLRILAVALSPLVIPPLMLLTVAGFQTESRVLQEFRHRRYEHRTRDLVKQEFADLLVRLGTLTMFGVALWVVLTLTADAACKLLFDWSPIFGPLAAAGQNPWGYLDPFDVFGNMLVAALTHPQVLATGVVTALATYSILRLAWFFAYIDLRIRTDCWDLEIALADEVQRWESPA